MENIIIAAILTALVYTHVPSDEKREAVKEPPKTVQWVIITDE